MNYFEKYGEREEYIISRWLEENPWLKEKVKNVRPINNGFHDFEITFLHGTKLIIEIKEEESYWFKKTGNIGLDYLSAFEYKNSFTRNEVENNNNWINKKNN